MVINKFMHILIQYNRYITIVIYWWLSFLGHTVSQKREPPIYNYRQILTDFQNTFNYRTKIKFQTQILRVF